MNVEQLMSKLTNAVNFQYKKDKTAAGVTVALLNNGRYYASVVRYKKAFSQGKQVVAKATANSLQDVLTELALVFTNSVVSQDPVQELRSFLNTFVEDGDLSPAWSQLDEDEDDEDDEDLDDQETW